jgi:hypothetical protein
MSISTTADNSFTSKRVFLRLHSSMALNETEILHAFLSTSGYSGMESNQHYVHYEPPQYSHFHIIIDIDYAQITDPSLEQLPHEVYKVSFKAGSSEP